MRTAPPVLLDLGNVLVRVHFSRFADRAAALSGIPAATIAARWAQGPRKALYESGRIGSGRFFTAMARELGLPAARRGELVTAWADIFGPVPGAASAVAALAARGPVWLVSDTNAIHHCWCRRRWPWLRLCAPQVVSWRRGCLKAAPGAFAALAASAGRPPGELVFLDDLPANVAAAREAGLDGRLFTGWPEARRALGLGPAGR